MQHNATPPVGSVVTARPYAGGCALRARKGVIVGDFGGTPLVWFPGMGDPQPGVTAHPIGRKNLQQRGGLSEESDRTLLAWERAGMRTNLMQFVFAINVERKRRVRRAD